MLQRIRGVIERDPRLSRVLHGGASALLGSVVALGVSAISLPLTVRYLGAEQYGIWVTVSTTVVLMSVLDLGIANSLTNMIAKAFAADDKAGAQRSYATALWTCGVVSVAAGVAAWALWGYVPWATLFRVHEAQLAHAAEVCAAIAVAFFLVSLPLKLINRVLGGYQETQIANYASLMNSVLGLVAILAVMAWGGSLVQLMLFYSVMMLAGTLALNAWVVLWRKRWMMPWPSMVSAASVRELLGTGSGFLLLQISGLVVFNSDNLVIAHYLGAAEVTPYSVTMRLATYATALQIALFPSLWPAYAEAYARSDYEWVRRVFWKAARYAMAAAGLAIIVLALFGRPLIRWYVGAAAVPSEMLILAICVWTLIVTGMDLEACLLAAVSKIKMQSALSLVAAALNIWLSIFLVKKIGAVGVVAGTILSYLLVLVVPQTLIVSRALREGSPSNVGLLKHSLVWAVSALRLRVGMRLLSRFGVLPKYPEGSHVERDCFLVVYLAGHIGDTVMMLPMIEALRAAHPEAQIECAVHEAVADFLTLTPMVDRVWRFNLEWSPPVTLLGSAQRSWHITRQYLERMAGRSFPTVCIVPRWGDDSPRSIDLAYLTQAPRRVGFDYPRISDRFPFSEQAMTELVAGGHGMHEPGKALFLLQTAKLIPELDLREMSFKATESLSVIAESVSWQSLASRLRLNPEERFAIIAPGASQLRRVWPLERWIQLAESVQSMGWTVLVLSGREDANLAASLCHRVPKRSGSRCLLVAGTTTLIETVALIRRSGLFVGADSGPGHIAGALDIPTVVLMVGVLGANVDHVHSPERMHPSGPRVRYVAIPETLPPCVAACEAETQHCILSIEVEDVLAALQNVLGVESRSQRYQSIASVSRG